MNTDAETFRVATLSAIFEERHEAKRKAVRVAHDIDKKVEGAKGRVQGAEENVKSIEEKAQMIIDGTQTVFSLFSAPSPTFNFLTSRGKRSGNGREFDHTENGV